MKGPAVLKERDFRLFFVGQSASLLGDGMVGVALAFAVLDLTGSPADLGYVLAARTIPLIAVLLIGGVIADRLPRHRIMVTADLARFLGQAAMATLLISGHARIWELAALQVLHGAATATFNPASTGLIPSIVTGSRLQQANALRGLAISIGNIAGPVAAGVLVTAASPGWAIAADAATFAISAIVLTRLRPPAHRPPPAQSFIRDLREGWGEFSSRTWVWTTVTVASLTNLLFAAFLVLGPAISERSLGGPAAWAAIQAVLGAGALIGGIAALSPPTSPAEDRRARSGPVPAADPRARRSSARRRGGRCRPAPPRLRHPGRPRHPPATGKQPPDTGAGLRGPAVLSVRGVRPPSTGSANDATGTATPHADRRRAAARARR